jgi:serine/threonine protein kinase
MVFLNPSVLEGGRSAWWHLNLYINRMTGARIGNWFVEEEIGRGSLGVVYRARDYDHPERCAAVKVFTATSTQDPAFVQKFAAEMLPLQRLDHANIAKFYDSGTHGGLAYVACELVEGEDLAARLAKGRRPWREVLSVAVQVARALKHGHNRNVLHRDLKPAHLMLTADGTVKVLGFGLAKVVPAPPPTPLPAIGSAAYIPPETASGKPLTRRSDFYSLGGVLYTLVTGRPPFAAATLVELMHKQCYTLPERPALLVPDLPAELDDFICALLDKNPGRRPATAAAVLDELERIRGKLERKGEQLEWPSKLTPDTAEAAALSVTVGEVGGSAELEREPRPLMKRPIVVVPLFLAVLVALALGFIQPWTKSADELYAAAQPLIESPNPDDWEKAADYLEELSRKYPNRFTEEVAAARGKVKARRDLKRAIADGAKVEPQSEAERAYLRGLSLAQAGDPVAARRTWRALVDAFSGVPSESRWVDLAATGLMLLDRPESRSLRPPLDRSGLSAALTHAQGLPEPQRTSVFQALEQLFQEDAAVLEAIRAAKR